MVRNERDISGLISSLIKAIIDPVHVDIWDFHKTIRSFGRTLDELSAPPHPNMVYSVSQMKDELASLLDYVDELLFPHVDCIYGALFEELSSISISTHDVDPMVEM